MPAGERGGPYAITVDGAGRLLVARSRKDTIAMLDPKTGQFQVFSLPSRNEASARRSSTRRAALVHGLAQRQARRNRITRLVQPGGTGK